MALSLQTKKILIKLGVIVCLIFIITGFTIIKFAAMLVPTYIELTAMKSALFVHFNAENIMLHVATQLAGGNSTNSTSGGSAPPQIDFSDIENMPPEVRDALLSYPAINVLAKDLERAIPLIGSAIFCCAIGFTFLKVIGGVYVCYVKPLVKAEKEEEQLEILLAKTVSHQNSREQGEQQTNNGIHLINGESKEDDQTKV